VDLLQRVLPGADPDAAFAAAALVEDLYKRGYYSPALPVPPSTRLGGRMASRTSGNPPGPILFKTSSTAG